MAENQIAKLLDENNDENIFLEDNEGKLQELEQIAIIPIEELIYVLLRPLKSFNGAKDDEAVVFKVSSDEENKAYLDVVTNDDELTEVFNEYNMLIEANYE